jgi:tetratricopeptide (TPR) repeat protein
VIAVLLALALAGPVEDGATAWDAGDLDGAVTAWTAAVDEGQPSGTVLYNLGNAWYRKGDLPRAVAYYRAARLLHPRDGWVMHNLAITRGELDRPADPMGFAAPWAAVATSMELGIIGTLVLAASSMVCVLARRRKILFAVAGALALLGVSITGLAVVGDRWLAVSPIAVVVGGDAIARALAVPDAAEAFKLPEGSEVRVQRVIEGFVLVEDSTGKRGWIPRGGALLVGYRGEPLS